LILFLNLSFRGREEAVFTKSFYIFGVGAFHAGEIAAETYPGGAFGAGPDAEVAAVGAGVGGVVFLAHLSVRFCLFKCEVGLVSLE
jgi:hypothetical protein